MPVRLSKFADTITKWFGLTMSSCTDLWFTVTWCMKNESGRLLIVFPLGIADDLLLLSSQDVAMKIISFAQQCSRAVCVLSSTGSVSTVTLRQSSSPGGTVTYEGRYEILSLSGLLLLCRGLLVAVTPVQTVVGSFSWGNLKPENKKREGPSSISSSCLAVRPRNPTSTSLDQKLSDVLVGMWPDDSQPVDIDNVHDIDLMRG
ncbi:hypothetical protein MLD38_039008 [Melastoma candidum]|uniref:Uncharacterized protein n=1 Tax=Melastoma candidum TaxID=119954 RepID=A0ACB9L278_9MYRT|nr:hypothetical protein MLD38_039008 [Melastoma candidum]